VCQLTFKPSWDDGSVAHRPEDDQPEPPDPDSEQGQEPDTERAPPIRSRDDSDIGWGDLPDEDDDRRLRDNRPPHWDE
jgi:hypothetical protein